MAKSKKSGFTVFEIIFVMGFFVFLGAISLPFSIDAYQHYILSTETQMMVSILRRAQDMAMANKYEDSFGISIQENQYVLFRGTSYLSRTISFDEIYPKAKSIAIAPSNDIVFESVSGEPDEAVMLTFSNTNSSQKIDINSQGAINW